MLGGSSCAAPGAAADPGCEAEVFLQLKALVSLVAGGPSRLHGAGNKTSGLTGKPQRTSLGIVFLYTLVWSLHGVCIEEARVRYKQEPQGIWLNILLSASIF